MQNSKKENEEFFKWLFDKENINMESEIDLVLCESQYDPNIYYPEELGDFFRTSPMQRLKRILQLGRFINVDSNTYHTRFDHCLGTFNKKRNILIRLYKDPEFKKYIEDNHFKIYLIAELIKSAGHDIGHLPLSHVLEVAVIGKREFHEDMGKRILKENEEIQKCLKNISPDLPKALDTVLSTDFFGFKLIDEGNLDIDRIDYYLRDGLHRGKSVKLVELFPFTIEYNVTVNGKILDKIPVFDISYMHEIEDFLNARIDDYKNGYIHPLLQIEAAIVSYSINFFIEQNEPNAKKLQHFLVKLKNQSSENIDLDEYLSWDDLNFYAELLDIAEYSEDSIARTLATLCIPNLDAFLTMLYTMLDYKNNQFDNLSKDDQSLLLRVKSFINPDVEPSFAKTSHKNELSRNLSDPNYFKQNVLYCDNPDNLKELGLNPDPLISFSNTDQKKLKELGNDLHIYFGDAKLVGYKTQEPIYIRDTDGTIRTIDQIPGFSVSTKTEYIKYVYCLLPLLGNTKRSLPECLVPADLSILSSHPFDRGTDLGTGPITSCFNDAVER